MVGNTLRNRSQATSKSNAGIRLPDAAIRDTRLDPAALVIAAWQATFAGDYAARATTLRKHPSVRAAKCGTGLGRDVIKRANRVLLAAGYKRRWQPPSKGRGSFKLAVERLTLPPCGKAGCIVQRAWFDGQLSLSEMAADLISAPATPGPEALMRSSWRNVSAGRGQPPPR